MAFENECFVISPIGPQGSIIRDRADKVLRHVINPAVQALGRDLTVVRADDINAPGQITQQVIEHCVKARVAVADLTDSNANVFYELGLRHARNLPTVLISELQQLPFDVASMRTIFYDHTDLDKVHDCIDRLTKQLEHALDVGGDSPVTHIEALPKSNPAAKTERTISAVLYGIDKMMDQVSNLERRFGWLEENVAEAVGYPEFSIPGHERQVVAWLVGAMSLLGADARGIVTRRLGLLTGGPTSSEAVAEELGLTAEEVDEVTRSALTVWRSNAAHEEITPSVHATYRDLGQLLGPEPDASEPA